MAHEKPPRVQVVFDIKPVDDHGQVDVSRIAAIGPELLLRSRPNHVAIKPETADDLGAEARLVVHDESLPTKAELLAHLERAWHGGSEVDTLSRETIHEKIFHAVRGQGEISREIPVRPRRVVSPTPASAPIVTLAVTHLRERAIEEWYTKPEAELAVATLAPESPRPTKRRLGRWPLVLMIGMALTTGAWAWQHQVRGQGTLAVENLQAAQQDLETLDFAGAADRFSLAYDQFDTVGESFDFIGASLANWLSQVPGGSTIVGAQQLTQIGKLAAATGQAMSKAVASLAGFQNLVEPSERERVALGDSLPPLRAALTTTEAHLAAITGLVDQVDANILPKERQGLFVSLKEKLPLVRELVTQATNYATFLEHIVGTRGDRRFLVLFQNASELRPSGGFPGTYAVIWFRNGRLVDFKVDDIYNPDGQLKQLITPPKELQHITPNWAMRDAGWFVNFPDSAQKFIEFYALETGQRVDGVLTLNPAIAGRLLALTGPIAIPNYNLTLTQDNFLALLQSQVEYGPDKKDNKPKKVITELAPLMLQRLTNLDHDTWLKAVEVFVTGAKQRDILTYFVDSQVQRLAREQGFTGEVYSGTGDFVMPTFTNVKGSKSDAVTDTAFDLTTRMADDGIHHTLTITRQHTGGTSEYGFYNRQNSSFVRVLVPLGSHITSLTGATPTRYAPLLQHAKAGYGTDADLKELERTRVADSTGAVVMQEAGKTEFGFWMNVDPGTTRTVTLEYVVPTIAGGTPYQLYVQRQPGLVVKRFSWAMTKPAGAERLTANVALAASGDQYRYTGSLDADFATTVNWR